jgi:hypothetical protein
MPGDCHSKGETTGSENAIWKGALGAQEKWNRDHPSEPVSVECIPSNLPWGMQTREMVRAIYEEDIAILVGAFDRRTAHLAAQVITRAKGRALLVTLTDDPTLTQINVPWIFQIRPSSLSEQGEEKRTGLISEYTYDAVLSAATALSDSLRTGKPLQQSYRQIRMEGLTGLVRFDTCGNRLLTRRRSEPAILNTPL